MSNLKDIGDSIIMSVKGYVARATEPLLARITELEVQWRARPTPEKGERGESGMNGKDGSAGINGKDGANGIDGVPGKDGRDGIDGKNGEIGAHGKDGRDGVDGKPGLHGRDGVDGKNGADGVNGKDGAPGVNGKDGAVGKDGQHGEKGADGLNGKDGTPGMNGKDVDYTAVRGLVLEAVAVAMKDLPRPQDGKDAAHLDPHSGIDVNRSYPRGDYALHAGGLWRAAKSTSAMNGWECVLNGIASVTIETENEREFCVKAKQTNGTETVTRFKMATPLDRGVWKPDAKYEKGDGVTYGGSWFIAQVDAPSDRPEVSEQWRLATKRGRDGKDGVMREPPKPLKIKVGP